MEDSHFSIIIALIILLIFSAYFSATETAFTGLNRSRLKTMANMGDAKAQRTLKMADDYDRLLSTLLVGNNLVNIVATSLATVLFTSINPKNGVLISTIVMTVAVLIFGEISPKSLAKEAPLRFAMFATPLLRFFTFILTPLTFIFGLWRKLLSKIIKLDDHSSDTEEELLTIVGEAEAEGGIDPLEGELIRSAIEFNESAVEDILTPRVNIVAVTEDDSMDQVEATFVQNRFSRLPVYSGSIDSIIGVIHEKDFLAEKHYGNNDIKPIIKKVLYTSPTMKISTLLRLLQREKLHLAVVIDEFGGTEGIVTLEDILEELVGEIWDEHDEVIESIKRTAERENHFVASGDANMEDLFDLLGVNTMHMDYDSTTVGGWLIEQMERIPETGEELIFGNIRFTVRDADERVIKEVEIEIMPPEEEEDEREHFWEREREKDEEHDLEKSRA